MKVFDFSIPVTGTEYYVVEADTLEEAIELLKDDSSMYKHGDDIEWDISKNSFEDYLDESYEVDEDEEE